jgi:hypothetical protein
VGAAVAVVAPTIIRAHRSSTRVAEHDALAERSSFSSAKTWVDLRIDRLEVSSGHEKAASALVVVILFLLRREWRRLGVPGGLDPLAALGAALVSLG